MKMKNIIAIILTMTMTLPAFAVGPAPKELKGGKIVVTTADGKTYTFSSDEYAVVKRGSEATVTKAEAVEIAKTHLDEGRKQGAEAQDEKIGKNIISVGAVRSKNGFDTKMTNSTVDVESRKDIGASVQYQRRFNDNKYLGGRVDTNGGAEINIGVGF
jgi:hypothetical protein